MGSGLDQLKEDSMASLIVGDKEYFLKTEGDKFEFYSLAIQNTTTDVRDTKNFKITKEVSLGREKKKLQNGLINSLQELADLFDTYVEKEQEKIQSSKDQVSQQTGQVTDDISHLIGTPFLQDLRGGRRLRQ